MELEYDDALGCVAVDGIAIDDCKVIGNIRDIAIMNKRVSSMEKFSGGVLRADMVSARFDDTRKEQRKSEYRERRLQVLLDEEKDVEPFGRNEWINELNVLARARTLKRYGYHEPYLFENKIYPDSLERWVGRHMEMDATEVKCY